MKVLLEWDPETSLLTSNNNPMTSLYVDGLQADEYTPTPPVGPGIRVGDVEVTGQPALDVLNCDSESMVDRLTRLKAAGFTASEIVDIAKQGLL